MKAAELRRHRLLLKQLRESFLELHNTSTPPDFVPRSQERKLLSEPGREAVGDVLALPRLRMNGGEGKGLGLLGS